MVCPYSVGQLGTNAYLVYDDNTKKAVIIDPGDDGEFLAEEIRRLGLHPAAILLTHGHFDHFSACDLLRERYGIPLWIHAEDAPLLQDMRANASGLFFRKGFTVHPADSVFSDNDTLTFDSLTFQVIHTPGHTKGSVCFLLKQPSGSVLFSGDTLFHASIGRTDFPGGSTETLYRSLDRIYALGPMLVYPGHGQTTELSFEATHNPYHKANKKPQSPFPSA